jgi:hypothetical protein
MNIYASSVALLWTTAMRLGRPRREVQEAERSAPNRRVGGCGEPRPWPCAPSGPPGVPGGPCEHCYFWSE